jgi:hypothetical protein
MIGELWNSTDIYTAPQDCCVYAYIVRTNSSSGNVKIYVNNEYFLNPASNDYNDEYFPIYLAKGDTIQYQDPYKLTYYRFYIKGLKSY